MSGASYGVALVFLASGGALGWYANRAAVSHADVKSTKAKLPGFRRTRHRSGVITIILALVLVVVVFGIFNPHK